MYALYTAAPQGAQTLPVHVPEQQMVPDAHSEPAGAHSQVPPAQLPVQQSPPLVHAAPTTAHTHVPAPQEPAQQSESFAQVTPAEAHAQLPSVQAPEQHNASLAQTVPAAAQTHAPPRQAPVQHIAPSLHAMASPRHSQFPVVSTAPEQHADERSPGSWVTVPGLLPGATQQTATSHAIPGSHCALAVQVFPYEVSHV
jgi:hypothetical protein